jgi:hypothetical protein
LFLKVIEELQNILVFRMEWMSLLHNWISSCNFDHDWIQNKPLGFTSFLQSNLRTINDIWDSNNTNFKSCHDIYNLLIDRRNCISEFSKIKKEIPEKFIKIFVIKLDV